ncbi:MAG: T9SS C-terminal target domain-containing protein [Alphaproteobacteria bacterium]|nr:MAG: T9SS C-terminal target domain-containing protein [Alphaproteobacteria bacterium]
MTVEWSNLSNPNYILDSLTQLFIFELRVKHDMCDTTKIEFNQSPLPIQFYDKNFNLLDLNYDDSKIYLNVNTCLTGVDNVETAELFYIYPNPASDKIFIDATFKYNHLILRNSTGQKIAEYDSSANEIDVSLLPRGYYLIEITSTKERIIKKLILI